MWDFRDSSLLDKLGTAWGPSKWPELWWGERDPGEGISVEEGGKRRQEGALGSFCCLWLIKGRKTDIEAGPLEIQGHIEGLCTLGSLTLVQQRSVRQDVNLKWGISIRKRADSHESVMKFVLNRHKKWCVSWILPRRKAAVNYDEGFNHIDG